MPAFTMRSIIFAIPWPSFLATKPGPLIFSLLFLAPCQSSASSGFRGVGLETFPRLGEVTTQGEPTRLVLAVLDGAGQLVPGARLRLRLQAPEPGWLPTDLPVIEGSRLVELELPASSGTAEWEYFFPIRGVYYLEVTVFDDKGEVFHRVFDLPVKESRLRLFYLATFVLFLFVFGVGAGRWLDGAHRRRRSSNGIGVLLLIAAVMISFFTADLGAQDHKKGEPLAVDRPVGGKTSRIRWGSPERNKPVLLTLTITNLEEDRRVLFIPRVPTQGSFTFDFQFTSGGRHRVMALAEAEGESPVREEKVVTVAAIEPAGAAMVPTMFLSLAVIAAGMVVGYTSRRTGRGRVRRKR